MKKFLILILFTGLVYQSWAQSTSCAQTLRLATSTYEQGRLHELEGILSSCLTQGFTNEQKVAAYKLLTQAYIYLEEPKKADSTMLELLNTDHYFQINPEIDPAEFVALYKTFRTDPVLAVGLKVGGALTLPSVMSDYYVADASKGTGKYSPALGFTVGLMAQKEIGKHKKIVLAPEIMFTTRSITETSLLFTNDSTKVKGGSYEAVYKQNWVDFNAIVRYKLNAKFDPYVGIGPGISFSLSEATQLTTTGLTNTSVSGPDVDIKKSFNTTVLSVMGVVGAKLRIGSIYVEAEVRYQQGLTNVINGSSRTNIEMAADYAGTSNDFNQSKVSGTLAVVYPIFKPIKLKK